MSDRESPVAVEFRCSFGKCATLLAIGYLVEPEGGLFGHSAGRGRLESRSRGRERREWFLMPGDERRASIEPCPRHSTTLEPSKTRTRISIWVEWDDVAEAVEKFRKDRRRHVIRIGLTAPADGWITDQTKGFGRIPPA